MAELSTEHTAEQDTRVRLAVYGAFAAGAVPTRADVARATGLTPGVVAESYERLADAHVLVLDPTTGEVWMAMPFSAVPTEFRVVAGETAWWANCAWDALGVAVTTERAVGVATRCADCGEPIALDVGPEDGPRFAAGVVHFAVPAARWWDDIGFT